MDEPTDIYLIINNREGSCPENNYTHHFPKVDANCCCRKVITVAMTGWLMRSCEARRAMDCGRGILHGLPRFGPSSVEVKLYFYLCGIIGALEVHVYAMQ